MMDYRNENVSGHILTIEDPVEFLFKNKKSVVNQREIGTDTASLQVALKNALRQAPDVILIGEIRDRRNDVRRRGLRPVGPLVPGHHARQQQLPSAEPDSELLPR